MLAFIEMFTIIETIGIISVPVFIATIAINVTSTYAIIHWLDILRTLGIVATPAIIAKLAIT